MLYWPSELSIALTSHPPKTNKAERKILQEHEMCKIRLSLEPQLQKFAPCIMNFHKQKSQKWLYGSILRIKDKIGSLLVLERCCSFVKNLLDSCHRNWNGFWALVLFHQLGAKRQERWGWVAFHLHHHTLASSSVCILHTFFFTIQKWIRDSITSQILQPVMSKLESNPRQSPFRSQSLSLRHRGKVHFL